jgi:hypothetical protein
MQNITYDLFVTHAWRYHDDWTRLGDLLDRTPELSWRNFSVPWYDPGVDPNSEVGARFVRQWLESQIKPVAAVIFLGGVYAVKSARKWLELEVEMARQRSTPIIGLPSFGQVEVAADARRLVDAVASWEALEIITAVDRLKPPETL